MNNFFMLLKRLFCSHKFTFAQYDYVGQFQYIWMHGGVYSECDICKHRIELNENTELPVLLPQELNLSDEEYRYGFR